MNTRGENHRTKASIIEFLSRDPDGFAKRIDVMQVLRIEKNALTKAMRYLKDNGYVNDTRLINGQYGTRSKGFKINVPDVLGLSRIYRFLSTFPEIHEKFTQSGFFLRSLSNALEDVIFLFGLWDERAYSVSAETYWRVFSENPATDEKVKEILKDEGPSQYVSQLREPMELNIFSRIAFGLIYENRDALNALMELVSYYDRTIPVRSLGELPYYANVIDSNVNPLISGYLATFLLFWISFANEWNENAVLVKVYNPINNMVAGKHREHNFHAFRIARTLVMGYGENIVDSRDYPNILQMPADKKMHAIHRLAEEWLENDWGADRSLTDEGWIFMTTFVREYFDMFPVNEEMNFKTPEDVLEFIGKATNEPNPLERYARAKANRKNTKPKIYSLTEELAKRVFDIYTKGH